MSQVTKKGPVAPSLNITPLIDVVFLLIVFFMLVSKITSDEAVEMILPDIQDSAAIEMSDENRIVINVVPFGYEDRRLSDDIDNPLMHRGDLNFVQVGASKRFLPSQLADLTAELKDQRAKRPDAPVLLRADGALYYEAVTPVLNAITAAEIGDVKLVAYLPEDQR